VGNFPHKTLLLLDKAPSHPSKEELIIDGIWAMFLPPTVTNLVQLMDQDILECLKRKH
jgi:hypothetical protein